MKSCNFYSAPYDQMTSHPQWQRTPAWGLEQQVPVRATSPSLAPGASEGTAEFHHSGWRLGDLRLAHTMPVHWGKTAANWQTHSRSHQIPPGILGRMESLHPPQQNRSRWDKEPSKPMWGKRCSPSQRLCICPLFRLSGYLSLKGSDVSSSDTDQLLGMISDTGMAALMAAHLCVFPIIVVHKQSSGVWWKGTWHPSTASDCFAASITARLHNLQREISFSFRPDPMKMSIWTLKVALTASWAWCCSDRFGWTKKKTFKLKVIHYF